MKFGIFTTLFSTLAISQALATDLDFTESIRGKMAASEAAAGVNFKDRCDLWEKTVREDAGNAVLYVSCGADKPTGFSTRYATTECYTKVTENGQTYQECGDEWHDNAVYGYASISEGKVLLTVSGDFGQINDQIGGEKTSCAANNAKECYAAREKAFNSFEDKCTAFRAKAKASFGARYLYANCGDPKNDASNETVTQFQYVSKGTIYYKK